MSEVWFYHVLRGGVDKVVPVLLEKSLEKGWSAIVEGPDTEHLDQLDATLWTYRQEGFLPHARAGGPRDARQPVILTEEKHNPNDAQLRVLIDGAEVDDATRYERVIYVFDGRNDAAVETARDYWKRLKASDADVAYWQQNDRGGWEKKA
ncbi:MAG: DNA polymerase III subunit chi [Pseudomonadota bacterium]